MNMLITVVKVKETILNTIGSFFNSESRILRATGMLSQRLSHSRSIWK